MISLPRFVVLLALVATITSHVGMAEALQCRHFTSDLISEAEVVFVGTVYGDDRTPYIDPARIDDQGRYTDPRRFDDRGGNTGRVRFIVDRKRAKGIDQSTVVVFKTDIPHRLEAGRRFIVFASGEGDNVRIGPCSLHEATPEALSVFDDYLAVPVSPIRKSPGCAGCESSGTSSGSLFFGLLLLVGWRIKRKTN